MVVFVQPPQKAMHHVLVQKPCKAFHKYEGCEHDEDVGGDLHKTNLHFPNVKTSGRVGCLEKRKQKTPASPTGAIYF
jgi:hypothetical protein